MSRLAIVAIGAVCFLLIPVSEAASKCTSVQAQCAVEIGGQSQYRPMVLWEVLFIRTSIYGHFRGANSPRLHNRLHDLSSAGATGHLATDHRLHPAA